MKKNFSIGCALLMIGLFLPSLVFAEDGLSTTQQVNMTVGGTSLIGITGGTVDLSLTAGATQAGQSLLKNSKNDLTRLRISSYVTGTGKNKITAKATTGSLFSTYTKLYLRLKEPENTTAFINYEDAGGDLKNQGNQVANEFGLVFPVDDALITDHATSQNPELLLVDNIGFCWSGTGSTDGYVVEYTYGSIEGGTPKSSSVTITYTIAADI